MADYVKMAIPVVYIGENADTKPTGVAVGSLCYEHDTGDWYITRDGTNWDVYKGDTRWLTS